MFDRVGARRSACWWNGFAGGLVVGGLVVGGLVVGGLVVGGLVVGGLVVGAAQAASFYGGDPNKP